MLPFEPGWLGNPFAFLPSPARAAQQQVQRVANTQAIIKAMMSLYNELWRRMPLLRKKQFGGRPDTMDLP